MEYYSAVKKNDVLLFAAKWTRLEAIRLSEMSRGRRAGELASRGSQNGNRKAKVWLMSLPLQFRDSLLLLLPHGGSEGCTAPAPLICYFRTFWIWISR